MKSHVYGITFSFTQSLIFFAYAAIFTFGAFLIKKELVTYENMFKYVAMAIVDFVTCLSQIYPRLTELTSQQFAVFVWMNIGRLPLVDALSIILFHSSVL